MRRSIACRERVARCGVSCDCAVFKLGVFVAQSGDCCRIRNVSDRAADKIFARDVADVCERARHRTAVEQAENAAHVVSADNGAAVVDCQSLIRAYTATGCKRAFVASDDAADRVRHGVGAICVLPHADMTCVLNVAFDDCERCAIVIAAHDTADVVIKSGYLRAVQNVD